MRGSPRPLEPQRFASSYRRTRRTRRAGAIRHHHLAGPAAMAGFAEQNQGGTMTAQKQPETQAPKTAARSTESGGRKPWVKKTTEGGVLEEVGKKKKKNQQKEGG